MHQHQAYAQAGQQGNVMNDIGEISVFDRLTAEHQHKGFAPVRIDVWQRTAKQLYAILMV